MAIYLFVIIITELHCCLLSVATLKCTHCINLVVPRIAILTKPSQERRHPVYYRHLPLSILLYLESLPPWTFTLQNCESPGNINWASINLSGVALCTSAPQSSQANINEWSYGALLIITADGGTAATPPPRCFPQWSSSPHTIEFSIIQFIIVEQLHCVDRDSSSNQRPFHMAITNYRHHHHVPSVSLYLLVSGSRVNGQPAFPCFRLLKPLPCHQPVQVDSYVNRSRTILLIEFHLT